MIPLKVIDLGIAPYNEVYRLQKDILSEKKRGDVSDYLILTEHPNVLTMGRRGSRSNVLIDDDSLRSESLDLVYTDRGGDVTFHGIGQVVAYPIFDLRRHAKDVRLFIRQLEKIIALTVNSYGIETDDNNEYTGVWVNGEKLGFVGIGLSSWITYHGISLNANVDLQYFSMIKPCGINGVRITSMKKILHRDIDIDLLKQSIAENFCEVFGLERCYDRKDASVAFAAAAAFGAK